MTFVTKLSFQSGDRQALEETVTDLQRTLHRKGVECKGPHSPPPKTKRVPLYKRLQPGDEFSPWTYTVYSRQLEIHGSDQIARDVIARDFPDSVHIDVEIDRKKPLGQGRE